jgi:uncharacterized protein YdcH (DUF465 family)
MTTESIRHRLKHLEEAHAVLDKRIDGIESTSVFSDNQLQQLKKERLCIKDRIHHLKEKGSHNV